MLGFLVGGGLSLGKKKEERKVAIIPKRKRRIKVLEKEGVNVGKANMRGKLEKGYG